MIDQARRVQPARPPRVLIDSIEPSARHNGYKRLVGDVFDVRADILCDGAPVLDACIRYNVPGEPRWRYAPLHRTPEPERWEGSVRLQSGGRYRIVVEAWIDAFATWRRELPRELGRQQRPRAFLATGRALLESAAARAAGLDRELLAAGAATLAAARAPVAEIARIANDRQLAKRMRVHGERCELARSEPPLQIRVERRRAGFAAWYAPFADRVNPDARRRFESELERAAELGFDVLCLPSDGVRGRAKTGQRLETLVARAGRLGLELALDLDPTAQARSATSRRRSPTSKSDDAWSRWLEGLSSWIDRGVRTFRVLTPLQRPFGFWAWILERLSREHPDVVFVAGRTAAKPARALGRLGFSQNQTSVEWNAAAAELRAHLEAAFAAASVDSIRPHLTVDLAATEAGRDSRATDAAARVQLLLAATLSPLYTLQWRCDSAAGAPGAGVLPDERVAHERLRLLNRVRRENRALQLFANLRFLHSENERVLFYMKSAPRRRNDLLIAVNLDTARAQEGMVHVPVDDLGLGRDRPYAVEDLLDARSYTWRGSRNFVRLDPMRRVGHVFRVVRERQLGEWS